MGSRTLNHNWKRPDLFTQRMESGKDKMYPHAPDTVWQAQVTQFASMGAMATHCLTEDYDAARRDGGGSWKNNESWEQSCELALKGKTQWVEKAQNVYDLLEAGGIDLDQQHWAPDRAGAFPVIPDYLAGVPECMRRKLTQTSDVAPVSMYASIEASASFESSELIKRGAAILALCMALQQTRPVELHLLCTLGGSPTPGIVTVKLDTVPMDLAQMAYLFGSAGYFRNLHFGMAGRMYGFDGHWAWGGTPNDVWYQRRIRAALRLTESDIYVPGIISTDESVQNPVAWVQAQLDRYKAQDMVGG